MDLLIKLNSETWTKHFSLSQFAYQQKEALQQALQTQMPVGVRQANK